MAFRLPVLRMHRKHDILSVPSYAESIYYRSQSDIISEIYHPFRKERIS